MALSITCPGCDAEYSVPENLAGKSIRCKACGETIAVKAPKVAAKAKAPVRAARDEDDEEDDTPKARSAARRRFEEEDDEDEVAPKKSNMPVIAFGLVALLIAGGVGGYFAFVDNKPEPDAVAKTDDTTGRTTPKINPIADTDVKSSDARPPKKTEPKKTEPKKTDEEVVKAEETTTPTETAKTEDKVEPVKKTEAAKKVADTGNKINDQPVAGVATAKGGLESGMSYDRYITGRMDPITLQMVKNASVFIICEAGGGVGSGSGWFGIEPGLVFTNAHVLHMVAPNAPPPKKITFYLNSGQPNQREIPHSKIKILAVDREIDIAVLQVINEPDLPPPLKVRPSSDCFEGLGLSTIGYPFGQKPSDQGGKASHKPEVSVRATTITAFRKTDFGILRRVQFEGAANPGNSGGPVVDAEGSVCTVVVEGVHGALERGALGGIALTMGVPTEFCFGLLAGRIEKAETQIAFKDGEKVRIPIKVKCLDPMNRIKSVGVAAWIGNPSKKFRAPGLTKPKEEPGDSAYIETELTYDSKTQTATGEIVLPKKPDGSVYWYQPYYSNRIVNRYWEPGQAYDREGEPADRENANLFVKLSPGKTRSVTMSTAALRPNDGEDAEGEASSNTDRVLLKFGLNVNEEVLAPDNGDAAQVAKLRMRFNNLLLPKAIIHGGEQDAMPKPLFERINNEVKKCGATALVNKAGEIYKAGVNTINVPNVQERLYVEWFTRSAVEALEATSITMPNKEVKPDETWISSHNRTAVYQDPPATDRRGQPIPGAKVPPPRSYRYTETLTMKYIGTRLREGKKEAMVLIDGKITQSPGSAHAATGQVRGYAMIELESGTVIESHLDKEFDIDTSEKGVKKNAVGLFKYDIKRSSTTN